MPITKNESTSGSLFTSITYSALLTLKNSNLLVDGLQYKITDRADSGIIVQAIGNNKISLSAIGIFLNPDYMDTGVYTGVVLQTSVAYTGNQGIWNLILEGTFLLGSVVFFNGNAYQVVNFGAINGSDPSVNTTAYTLLTKSTTKGYIQEIDSIHYNFDLDIIIKRSDKRNNIVRSFSGTGIPLFQWGNDNCTNNTVAPLATANVRNQIGVFSGNTLDNSVTILSGTTNIGNITNNYFSNSGFTYVCNSNVASQGLLTHCNVTLNETIVFRVGSINSNCICPGVSSNPFKEDLDMSSGSFVAGILTIPNDLNYIGRFNLTNLSAQTITKIMNAPSFRFGLTVQSGNNQLFSHTAVSGVVAGNMTSDTASINTIIGRATVNDSIEYEKDPSTSILRRYNIIKLA
jgi:hypothetical protein